MSKPLILLLASTLLAAPGLSFASNMHSLQTARSCCDGMNGSCGNAADPQSCCGSSIVRLESDAAPAGNLLLVPVAAVFEILPTQFDGLQFLPIAGATVHGSPPIFASPPLVLRI